MIQILLKKWFKSELIKYVQSDDFKPETQLTEGQLRTLSEASVKKAQKNTNFAFNPNDKTAN